MKVMSDQMHMFRKDEAKRVNREELFGIVRAVFLIALAIYVWSCAINERKPTTVGCWAAHGQVSK